MIFEEVLSAFRQGKKIRCNSWKPNTYVHQKGGSQIYFVLEGKNEFYSRWEKYILFDDWEVIE